MISKTDLAIFTFKTSIKWWGHRIDNKINVAVVFIGRNILLLFLRLITQLHHPNITLVNVYGSSSHVIAKFARGTVCGLSIIYRSKKNYIFRPSHVCRLGWRFSIIVKENIIVHLRTLFFEWRLCVAIVNWKMKTE